MVNRIFITLILCTILILALSTGFTLLWRLFFLSLAVISTGLLWVLVNSRGISAESKPLPAHLQVGDVAGEEITLKNSGRLPRLFLQVEETASLPGAGSAMAVNLPARGSRTWRNKLQCSQRGRYQVGALSISISEPFGLFSRRVRVGKPQEITICPVTVPLPAFDPFNAPSYRYGLHGRPFGQVSSTVAGVREYLTGDSLKHLHWHSTAHTGKLMVKLFDPDTHRRAAGQVWVVLDMAQPAQPDADMEEYGVSIAASLIKHYIDQGSEVGLIISSDQPVVLTPNNGTQHLWNMLMTLAVVEAQGNQPLEYTISTESRRFNSESLVIVVTPSRSREMVSVLRNLAVKDILVAAVLLNSVDPDMSNRNIGSILMSSGIQAYIVHRGDSLTSALDSRNAHLVPWDWDRAEPASADR